MHTIQLELPEEIYTRAKRVSKQTRQPIEKIVAAWIRPPLENESEQIHEMLKGVDSLPVEDLVQIALSFVPKKDSDQLGKLLSLQKQRTLSEAEHREAMRLIKQEDLLTLRKAKAIYLLKKHNALPTELTSA